MSRPDSRRALRRTKIRNIKRTKQRQLLGGMHRIPYIHITDDLVGILASSPCQCSRYCCGNPRRYLKGKQRLTTQELQHSLKDYRDE